MVLRLDSIDQLTQPGSLERVLGPVVRVRREPMSGASSFSGARHERVRVDLADGTTETLVLKLARPERNWIAQRTCDGLGREAALLAEPALAGVWEVFARTYLAFAQADGELGLLMVDLGEYLPPDVREPIAEAHEEALLTGLARLHARFWESPRSSCPGSRMRRRSCGSSGPRFSTMRRIATWCPRRCASAWSRGGRSRGRGSHPAPGAC